MTGFEIVATRAFFHPVGRVTLGEVSELVAQALSHARELGLEDILVNITGVSGFEPPRVFERYDIAMKWVSCARGVLRVAVVLRPEFIDSQKIGVLMAQNRGVSAEVFSTEASALMWLDSRLALRDIQPNISGDAHPGL